MYGQRLSLRQGPQGHQAPEAEAFYQEGGHGVWLQAQTRIDEGLIV
jgi:hypothetical protein